MHDEAKHHQELINGISSQMRSILDASQQAIYIYLDDVHKVCNKKFADMLGYRSPEEWALISDPFTDAFVEQGSQRTLVDAYQQAMEKMIPSTLEVKWKTKSGDTVKTKVVMVPISYEDHLFAMHFIA